MQPASSLADIAHVIQLAVAPVFLLTAIGTVINVLAGRLGRAVDRRRVLESLAGRGGAGPRGAGIEAAERDAIRRELATIERRVRLIYFAIALAVASALFVCLLIALAFIDAFVRADLARVIATLFVVSMVCLVACLGVFLHEIVLAVNTSRSTLR